MKTKSFFAFVIFLLSGTLSFSNPIEEGKTLFMSRCAACHNVNKVLTGPALAGVDQRRSIDWIINFVHSSRKMIEKGDQDAISVYEKFNKIPMPDHADLSGDNIRQIVEYIKSESKPVEENAAPFAKPRDKQVLATPLSSKDAGFLTAYTGIVLLFIASLLLAVHVRSMQQG